MGRGKHFFEAWAALMWDRHRWVALASAAILVSAPPLMLGLRFSTLTGTPLSGTGEGAAYRETMRRFGDGSPLVIVLYPTPEGTDALDGFTDALAAEIRGWDDILSVSHRALPQDGPAAASWRLAVALNNAGGDAAAAFLERLTPDGLRAQLRRSRKRLLVAETPRDRALIASDLLNAGGLAAPFYAARFGPGAFATSAYFDASDRSSRLVFVRPAVTAEDAPYAVALRRRLDAVVRRLQRSVGDGCIRVGYTGKYALAADGASRLQRELTAVSVAAALGLVLLFTAVFRNARATILCGLPVMVSMAAVVAMVGLAFNPVDLVAMGFTSIILGLAIDVTIHCVGRFYQMLGSAASLREAVIRTVGDCGPPVTIGLTTTAAAFLAMGLADFSGLRQFGALAAAGLMLSLVTTLAMFPAVVRWLYGRTPASGAVLRYHLMPRRLFGRACARPRLALAIAFVAVAAGAVAAAGFRFDMKIETALPANLPAVQTGADVARRHGTAFAMSAEVTIDAPTLADALRAQRALDDHLARRVREGNVAAFESPSILLPYPPEAPRDEAFRERARGAAAVRQTFLDEMAILGLADTNGAAAAYFDVLAGAARLLADGPDWPVDPAVAALLPDSVAREGGRAYLRTRAWPPGDAAAMASVKDLAASLRAVELPTAVVRTVTSTYEAYEELNHTIRRDFRRVSLIALAAVALLVLLYFRRWAPALLTLVPMAAAIPFTFGVLHASGRSFTPSGIGLIAMLIGIGVDNAVHILTRARDRGGANLPALLEEIGPVLALTSITTIIGFGVLMGSTFSTLSTMGFAVVVGVAACLVFTLLIVPAGLVLSDRRRARKPAAAATGALLLLAGALAPPAAAAEDPALAALLDRLQRNFEGVTAFSCRFEQRKKIAQLAGEVRLTGAMLFQKPHFLRLELRGGENLNLWADGQRVWLQDLDLGEVESYPAAGETAARVRQMLPPAVGLSPQDLTRQFDLALTRSPDGLERLTLAPRPGAAVPWRSAEMDFDRWGRLRNMTLSYGEGEYTAATFEGWRRLRPVETNLFDFAASSNVTLGAAIERAAAGGGGEWEWSE